MMKAILRAIAILVVSFAVGFAVHALVHSTSPSLSTSKTASPSVTDGRDGEIGIDALSAADAMPSRNGDQGLRERSVAGYPAGHRGSAIASLALVLCKFIAVCVAVAGLRALVRRLVSRAANRRAHGDAG